MEFTFNSPEEEIHFPLFEERGVKVFVKRDDLIHPFISGNKWRKLKYILHKAQFERKNHLITFGGAYSNHLLATACAAARFGFKATAFVRGENVNNPVLTLCKLFGMQLIFVNREDYREKETLFKNYSTDDNKFFIDEGGYSEEAARGCAEIVGELKNSYDHVFCAAGTGTTAAGLINGFAQNSPETTVNVVPVLKGTDLSIPIDRLLYNKTPFVIYADFHFGGYAKFNELLIDFIKVFASSTGIILDQVYTAKMMYALFENIRQEKFKKGSKLLAIHTGGLTGLLGIQNKI